jgi:hypothetical protein
MFLIVPFQRLEVNDGNNMKRKLLLAKGRNNCMKQSPLCEHNIHSGKGKNCPYAVCSLIEHHVMKAYWGSESIAPFIAQSV